MIEKSNENLRLYVKQVTLAQEEERLRIARELHDTSIQSLIAILHQAERFLEKNSTFNMTYIRFVLELSEQIKAVIQELRQLSFNLRPSILDHLGLMPSIEYLINECIKNHGIKINMVRTGDIYRFLPEVEVCIFRIVQEALNNIVRHAQATKVEVIIEYGTEKTNFIIRDNGKGMDCLPQILHELPRQRKLGLAGMVERTGLVEGELSIQSNFGKGTSIKISVPVNGNVADCVK